MRKANLPQFVAFSVAIALVVLTYSPVMAASGAQGANGYYVAIKILGSDGVPVVGEVGSVILNIACYGCGTIDTVSVANGVSDSTGVMNLQLPLGPYTMQVIRPGGGVYQEFNFNVPQTATLTVRLNDPAIAVQAALKANPIDLKQFTVYNASAVTGGQVDPSKWFLPNDDFAGLYSLSLMKALAGYQETVPIYVLPYTSPPVLLFGLAILMVALEPYAARSARKRKAGPESRESAK